MSTTTRRRLGTGPSTARSTPPTDAGPRLLPVERLAPDSLLDGSEHRGPADRMGRRALGPRGTEQGGNQAPIPTEAT
ncbi:hypothetical protein [Streptomyces sp. NPDC088744]|uniref:hypothetical protein n=1 Tax=Streptomyces sp. NPDC088744 TaxID=3155061 RepID=UPI0034501875